MKNLPHKILKETSASGCTVYLYGYIGQQFSEYFDGKGKTEENITDVDFLKIMRDCEKDGFKRLDVRINSYGGSMLHMDGIIALMQSSSMEVHTWVDGVAASAAADIWLAAKKERRHLAKNAKVMIHAPSAGAYGTAKVLRDAADMLDTFEAGAIVQMAADTGMSEEEVKSTYFDGSDHWLSARQCVEVGFCGGIEDYEGEKLPKNVEKMSAAELHQFFAEPAKEQSINLFKKLFHAAFPSGAAAVAVSLQEEEVMNIENFKTSVTGGDIALDDVTAYLREQGYTVEKAAPAAPPTPKGEQDVQALVDAAVKTHVDAVNALKTEVENLKKVLDRKPGAGPSLPHASTDPAGDGEVDEWAAINAQYVETAKRNLPVN